MARPKGSGGPKKIHMSVYLSGPVLEFLRKDAEESGVTLCERIRYIAERYQHEVELREAERWRRMVALNKATQAPIAQQHLPSLMLEHQ